MRPHYFIFGLYKGDYPPGEPIPARPARPVDECCDILGWIELQDSVDGLHGEIQSP